MERKTGVSDRLRAVLRWCHFGQGIDTRVEVSTSLYAGNN